MKHSITFRSLSIILILFVQSCSKEEINHSGIPSSPVPTTRPGTFNLETANWERKSENTFINVYKDFLAGKDLTGKTLSVYLVIPEGNVKMPILNNYFPFQGGRLWSETISNDLNINFQKDGEHGLPFGRLKIEVTIY